MRRPGHPPPHLGRPPRLRTPGRPFPRTPSAGEPCDQLGRLDRVVELGAMAGALDLDPLGLRELRSVSCRGARQRQDLVLGAPDEADGTGDPLGVESPALALGEGDERLGVADGGAADQVGDESADRWSAVLA